jgi:phospholipid transport system substrate-binding protein
MLASSIARITRGAIFTVGLTFLISSAQATPIYPDSGAFVTALGNRAIELLSTRGLTVNEQETRFRILLREGFDVRKIGRFVLGKYRRSSSADEVAEFLYLFEDYIVSLYSSAFRSFSGETFVVVRVIKTRSPRDTMVVTHINPDAPNGPTKIVFQVRNSSEEYKILDVKIQGVSMIVTQRDEFTGFIRNNGGEIGPLIKALRKKTKSLKTQVRKGQ